MGRKPAKKVQTKAGVPLRKVIRERKSREVIDRSIEEWEIRLWKRGVPELLTMLAKAAAYPGKQEPIVDRGTWDRVQAIVRGCIHHSHEMTHAGEFMTCGHCGHPITGERKTRQTKSGTLEYVYYRCSRYTAEEHPARGFPKPSSIDRSLSCSAG